MNLFGVSLGPTSFTVTFPIVGGSPTPLYVELWSFVQLAPPDEGSSSFLEAALDLTRISVFDAEMRPIEHFSLTSESGVPYPPPEQTTPEPGTFGLVLTCVAAVAIGGYIRAHRPGA